MKRTILFILLLFVSNFVLSQGRGNNWVFGDSSGISFTSGQPVAFTTPIWTGECSSAISDEQGNLLFYSGSDVQNYYTTAVWDQNGQKMPNGNLLEGASTITQGSIILPFPDDTNKYYIFNLSIDIGIIHRPLYFSIVDKSLNGGYGDISLKNILLCDSNLTEKMCAVRHANGRDWWLITHQYASNVFIKYLISANNAILGPYFQAIGDSILTGYWDAGQMIFNEEGTRLAMANVTGELDILDFDRCTGLFNNPLLLGGFTYANTFFYYYGCSFSPNDSVLYASTFDSLFQFNLYAVNVKASKTFLGSYIDSVSGQSLFMGQHLLGPDNKIYISLINFGASDCDSLLTHLSVINNPDNLGPSCNFSPLSIPLSACNGIKEGLPNMPNYNLGRLIGSACDTVTAVEEIKNNFSVSVYPNPVKAKIKIKCNRMIQDIKLFNITGATVFEETNINKSQTEINIAALPSSFYFLQVKAKDEIFNYKVVKL